MPRLVDLSEELREFSILAEYAQNKRAFELADDYEAILTPKINSAFVSLCATPQSPPPTLHIAGFGF